MKVLKSFGTGIRRSAKEVKMILILWGFNALFAIPLYFLVSGYLKNALGSSILSESLFKNFDFSVLLELLVHRGDPLRTIFSVSLLLGALFFLVSTFLHGGILFTLIHSRNKEDGPAAANRIRRIFFEGGGKYFGRFFRLTLYSLLLWFAGAMLFFILNEILKPLTATGFDEKLMFYMVVLKAAFAVFLFFMIRMILDYARVMIVFQDTGDVFLSLLRGVSFVFKRPGKTLGLYYLLVLTGLAVYLLYGTVQNLMPDYSYAFMVVSFVIGQVFILSRGWLKIFFQASQIHFYSLARTQA